MGGYEGTELGSAAMAMTNAMAKTEKGTEYTGFQLGMDAVMEKNVATASAQSAFEVFRMSLFAPPGTRNASSPMQFYSRISITFESST